MKSMNRPGIHKTGMQMLDNRYVGSTPLFRVIKLFVACYTAIQDFMHWAKMLRSGTKPLNELTVEGLYMKELEIFYFDFFDYKDWEKTKDTLRCLVTSVVLSIIFYLLATYLMDLDLRVRVITTCMVSTVLTLLLSYSPASRAVTFLMLPSMARGSLRNSLLVGCLVLLSAGPAYNLRSNLDAISSSKTCLHEQYFDIVSLVKSLHGKNVVNLLLLPIRLILAAIQLVAEIFYRIVHAVYMALNKLVNTMKRLFAQMGRFLSAIKPRISFQGSCLQLTRRLAKKFRRTRFLGGLIQMVFSVANLIRSISGQPPIAKPTIGYLVHKIGTGKVCPLLKRAKEIYREKKRKLKMWFETKIMVLVNQIKAVKDLIEDAIGPDTRVTIDMSGGIAHKLDDMKASMRTAVALKTKEVKESYRFATKVVQIVCSVLSLLVFVITMLLSINFYRCYMRMDDFENNYVTAPFLRLEELEPPILPLDSYEKSRVSILADAMISDIVKRLGGSEILFAVIRLVPFIVVMVLEWIFYAMASFMENTWSRAISIERNLDTRLTLRAAKDMAEKSPMALLLTIIIHVQKALRDVNMDINVLACSPKAAKPNWSVDALLCGLLILYTTLTLFGPFFLKLRHHIMLELEPTRSVQRAVWLRRQIQADRQLLPSNRDLLKMSQAEQENSSMIFLVNSYVRDGIKGWADSLRSLFNLPTIRCARCGIRGSLSLKNFNDFFTVCDSCESSICAPCAHYTDRNGAVKLRESCPSCGLRMEDVEIDAEEIEDEDPLNDMLYNFLDLMPGYKVSKSALAAHMTEIRAFKAEMANEESRSFMATLGADANIDPKGK